MDKTGSYLIFEVSDQRIGVELENVLEVVKAVQVDELGQSPDHVKGILNYHGVIMPVVNLRKIFNYASREDESSDVMIICETSKRKLALWAESVIGVIDKEKQNVLDAQMFFLGLDFVKGIFRYSDDTIILSDIDKFLTDGEMRKLKKILEQNEQSDR